MPRYAPNLFDHDPENDSDVPQDFSNLYLTARHTFCRRVLDSRSIRSVWEAALRPTQSWVRKNPKQYGHELHQCRAEAWKSVRPTRSQLGKYAEQDPTLLSVHSQLPQSVEAKNNTMDVVEMNLRLWVMKGLKSFWSNRFDRKTYALLRVRSSSVVLEGAMPEPMLEACGPYSSFSRPQPSSRNDR